MSLAAWLGGRDAGVGDARRHLARTACLAQARDESVPGLVTISLIVLTVQTLAAIVTG